MKGWPPCADIDWMLTMVPAIFSRRMTFAASWIRKNGRADVDREHAVEQLRRGVEDGAAIGVGGDVDQHVDAPEGLVGLGDHLAAILDLGEVGLHVLRP